MTQVMEGQGTLAVELLRQLHRVRSLFVDVGAVGAIGGIGAYIKSAFPSTEVGGCWPENSCPYESD